MLSIVKTKNALAIGPYSQAIKAGDFLLFQANANRSFNRGYYWH